MKKGQFTVNWAIGKCCFAETHEDDNLEVSQIAFPCRVDLQYPLYAKLSSKLLCIRARLDRRVGAQNKSADQLTAVNRE